MYIPCDVDPNEVSFAKILKTEDIREVTPQPEGYEGVKSLSVEGVSQDGEIVF